MDIFNDYFSANENQTLKDVLKYMIEKYKLVGVIKWNQPMLTDHDTFIIGFSIAKNHISVAVEAQTIKLFSKEIINAGYEHTSNIFKIKNSEEVNYQLLDMLVSFNIEDKKNCTTFFRK